MSRPLQIWLAAAAALFLSVAGCGGGTSPNPDMAPTITSTPPATANVGVPYNYTVEVDGMTPIGYEVVSGPEGFEIGATSGLVTWTPSELGTESIEIRATNLAGSDSQSFVVEVVGASGPVFTSDPPLEATVAAPYAYDPAVVANGEVRWSAEVAPTGLTVDPSTGAVRWTPTSDQVGEQNVTIRATEVEGGLSTDQAFVVTVSDTGGPAVITSTPPSQVYQGELWAYAATAAGAPVIAWDLIAPSFGTPAQGVSIDEPAEGPSASVQWATEGVAPGEYTIALRVQNGLGEPNVQEFVVTVEARPPAPEIDLVTVAPPLTVFVGTTYNYDVNLVPGTESPGVVFSLVGSTSPEGLAITVNPTTGEVAFTASEANGEIQYAYTVRAENVLGEHDEETITVNAVLPPAEPLLVVTPDTSFVLEVGESFPGASAMATGNPAPVLSISGTLPDFVEFDEITGLLSASSTKPAPENGDIGNYSFDIVATNSEGTDSETIDIRVIAAPPSVDSITPAAGRRQSEVPVVVRGAGFVSAASPTVRLDFGGYSESVATTFVDENTLSAVIPIDVARPAGVYDVVVDQGSTTTLAKRFTVTEGDGSTLSGSIAADLTLSAVASPHVVTGDVRIEAGATLTVEPGAVVMFGTNSNLRIDVGASSGAGALVADGGEPGVGDQVVFTRFQDVGAPAQSGHYRGLRFGANNISAVTHLRNVIVEFGGRRNGSTEQGGIEVMGGSAPTVTDSIVRESINYGLYVQSGAGSEVTNWFDRNQLVSNARGPISVGADDVSTLGSMLDMSGNGVDRVFVRGSTVARPTSSWNEYGIPFFLSAGLSVRNGAVLSFQPGTELRFATNTRLQVSAGSSGTVLGTLVAVGTPESPIRMLPDSGTWNGVFLDDDAQSGTVLRYVRVEGFGSSSNGGLRIDPSGANLIVENCLLQSTTPGSTGVFASGNAEIQSFENNVIDVEGSSVNAPFRVFHDLLSSSNRYETPLRVRSGTTGGTLVWTKPVTTSGATQVIRPDGNLTLDDGELTISAGTRVEMPLNGQLSAIDARLVIDGTVDEQVVFEPAPGVDYWGRIRLRGAVAGGASRISNAFLDTAGGDPALGVGTSRAGIVLEVSSGTPAIASISDTTIIDSNGYGITFADGTHCEASCTANTITGARFSAVRIAANYVGRFGVGNTLVGNNTSGTLGHEGIWVTGDVIDTSALWPAEGVPYVVQGDVELRQSYPLDPVPVVTIEPGTELRFAAGRRLRVGEGNDAVLDAQGTAEAPIVFTSVDTATPTFWDGIDFNQGSDGSILDHVVVSYGGERNGTGNVNFRIGSVVSIGTMTFSSSEAFGALIDPGSAPMFMGSPSTRVYELNGQGSIPGAGDPAFDCVRDVGAGTCDAL